ncbi:MAG: chorismate-binding protein, partial [Verrucomicrobiales bacterium]
DPKEIGEHEFVADTLVRRLSPLGDVARAPRQLLDLGAAVHFHTRIDVALDAEPPVGELIARLHPTPAVGAVPRSAEAMAALHAHRAALGCPAAFGAPFGVMLPGGEFHGIVLIRGVFWRDGGVGLTLPAGCGIVAESDPDREWAELALKRRMVRGWLGL